jgi:hypothetical protein
MEASDAAIFVLARIVRRESDEEEAPKFCARIGEELKERKEEGLGFRRLLHCCRGAKRSVSEEHLKALPIEHAIFDEHRLSLSRLSKIAVMVKSLVYLIIRDSQAHKFSK